MLSVPVVFAASVGKHPQKRYPVRVEERDHLRVKRVRCHKRVLPVVQLAERHFRVGVDEGLLVNVPNALKV